MPNLVMTYQPTGKTPGGIPVYCLGGSEFVSIPAGPFLMGSKDSNPMASAEEKPQHRVEIPYEFWLTRTLVTNEEYASYIGEGNHPVSDWRTKPNDPVVNVSWQDCMAYCKWLSDCMKSQLPTTAKVRLPTEAEWEKAARGTDGREWPWGNKFDKSRCDLDERGKRGTTPVGAYSPQGDSPYGCADMAGNAWEWTHSDFKPYPYRADDGRENEKGLTRVIRGGAFPFERGRARCAFRGRHLPIFLWPHYGFRAAIVFQAQGSE